jgi:hypothetical protein
MFNNFWDKVGTGDDTLAAVAADHENYRKGSRREAMSQLFADRERMRDLRDLARKLNNKDAARSLNAHIANYTRKMNLLMQADLDDLFRSQAGRE